MSYKNSSLTQSVIHGALWIYASTYSGKILSFIITVILARLLVQEDFGVAGYALIIIGFIDVPSFGIGPALIYYDKDTERSDTAFWLIMGISLGLFGLTWLFAPWAGTLYNDPRAIPVTRVLALTLPIIGLGSVHRALLQKDMDFKRRFIPAIVLVISKGLISISLAWSGFGAWSLIFGQLAGVTASMIALWIVFPWRPSFRFTRRLIRPLLSYSWNVVSVYVFALLIINIAYVLIGRHLGAAALGVYMLALRTPELLINQFCMIISGVIFPAYTKMRNDLTTLNRGFLTTMQYITVVTIPVGLGLALVAKPFVLTFFSEKWIEAIPVISAISIYILSDSLFYNVGDVFNAQGRPDLPKKLTLMRLIIFVPILWWAITTYNTLTTIAWIQAAFAFAIAILYLFVTSRILNIPFKAIMATLRPAAISGTLMVPVVLGVLHLFADTLPLIQLIVSITAGALAYCGTLWWLQREVIVGASHTLYAALVRR